MHKVLRFENDIEVIAPDDGSAVRYSEEAVKRVEDFFSLLVFGQNEWAGQPFVLLPWERQAIRSFYGVQVQDEDGLWVRYRRYLYTELPKKNGKSELSAGLGLYHLLADGEMRPHVGVFAADKTNADIIYQAAKYMVEHTAMSQPEHAPLVWCRDSVREIRTRSGGILKVYSADADTKHGYSFSAIIFDELHAQPNRRLWDVLTAGSNAARRQQAVIVLTTAGDDTDRRSIGWEIHEKCRRILEWRSQVFRAAAAEQNLYFLSRATKSTKKCPSRDLCRADDAERLEPRGVPAADSFPCRGNVPGASISLREDDAGPCDSRRRREYGQAEAGSEGPQGPAEGGTAAGAAARAAGFIPASEYEINGAPTKLAGFVGTPPGGGVCAGAIHLPRSNLMQGAPAEIASSDFSGDDPQWCPIMYGIGVLTGDDPDKIAALDIWDEELWKKCNPGLGHNLRLRDFRAEARAARQSEAAERLFRWLRLNQWISTKDIGWLPLPLYDKTQWNLPGWENLKVTERRKAAREALRGKKCFGGLDLSTTTDLTAFVLIFPPQDGLEHWTALFWAWRPQDGAAEAEVRDHVTYRDWARADFLTLCPGDMVDFSMVEETITQAQADFDIRFLGVDPYLSRTLTPRLMERGINVVEIPQDMRNLSPAMKELERLLRSHEMLHEHNTCARWCFGNVRCAVDGNENIKPMKNRSTGRIDIAVAWIIAMATALLKMPSGPDINEHIGSEDWSL